MALNTKITNLDATNYDGANFCLNNNGQILWGWGDVLPDNAQLYLYGAGGTKKITDDGNYHYNYGLADNGWITWLQNHGADDWRSLCLPEREFLSSGYGGRLCGTITSTAGARWFGAHDYPIFLASPAIASPGINSLLLLN